MAQPPTPTPPPLLNEDDDDSDSGDNSYTNNMTSQIAHDPSEVPVPKTPNRNMSRSTSVTPKTHSRRATPRSNRRNSTPGRGSVRRNPSTPYTLRAMQQVLATTPIRNVLRETRRYTPTNDLRMLSRLLVRERDELRKQEQKQELNHEQLVTVEEEETNLQETLAPPFVATRITQTQQQLQEFSIISESVISRLSDLHHTTTVSELDEEQRRLSERMSGRFSFPSNNLPSDLFNDLAVPEAVMDDLQQFDDEHFGYDNDDNDGDEFDNLRKPDFSSDYDDLDNDLIYSDDEHEFSLLRVSEKPPQFKPMNSDSETRKRKAISSELQIPISLLRQRSRLLFAELPTDEDGKFFKQKQFSNHMFLYLQEISDEFLTQQMNDLTLYAKHAKRKTINSNDVALLLKRHKDIKTDDFSFNNLPLLNRDTRQLSKSTEIFCLAEKFCNLSELRDIEANLCKNELALSKKQQKRKKKRKMEVKENLEGLRDEDEEEDDTSN